MKNNRIYYVFALIILFVGVGLLFWRWSSEKVVVEPVESNSGEIVSVENVLTSQAVPQSEYKIGVLFPFLAAPFWVNESFGIINEAELSGVEIVWLSADGYTNVSKQNNQIADLMVQGIDGLIIAPTSFEGNTQMIERAIQSGIPVVVHVTDTSAEGVTARVLADDFLIGSAQAKHMSDSLGDGAHEVVMLSGPAGADWADNRARGFKESISPNITIVSEKFGAPERAASQQIMEDLLVSFPDIDGVYTAADGMAIGAANAISAVNRSGSITLTTAAMSRESVPYIEDGSIALNVDESPIMQGRVAIRLMIHTLNGNKVPEKIIVPSPGYSKENIGDLDRSTQWAPQSYSPQ